MANKITFGSEQEKVEFGVGDVVRVSQLIIEEGKKSRTQVFEGTVIAIKNREEGKSFTVRRIGVQNIGIEMIFPLNSPLIQKIEVSREGMRGSRHAKLYLIRDKSKKEIERIYSRAAKKNKKASK
jgi:large subunit ribosomal protein L19